MNWGAFAETHDYRQVVAASDASVWVLEQDRMFRIGRKRTFPLKGQPSVSASDHVDVAPDGTVWRTATPKRGMPGLFSFDGRKWQRHKPGEAFCAVEAQPTGTVWATWFSPFGTGNGGCTLDTLGRWDGKRSRDIDTPKMQALYGSQLTSIRSDVWLCCKGKRWQEERLVRFDGRKFIVLDDPAPRFLHPGPAAHRWLAGLDPMDAAFAIHARPL